jgi:hypothetical protein
MTSSHVAQDLPLAQEQQENPPAPLNKYVYDEFAGYSGYDLLDRILQQVLTFANWRTWSYADSFVAPGNDCYVGPYRIASKIRPSVRKVEMDFKSLRDLGLMETYPDYRMVKQQSDGKARVEAVMIKDFSKLYAFAHEYYLWENSPEYIPPERQYKDLILADKALTEKLRRFDNYRRILECGTPGRKPGQGTPPMSQAEMLALAAKDAEKRNSSTETKEFNNTLDKTSSANRIPELNNNNNIDVSSYSTSEGEGLAVATIGNEYPLTTVDTQPSDSTSSKLNSPIPPNEERRGAARAVETELGYTEQELRQDSKKRGAAAIGIPADQYQKLSGGLDRTEEAERRRHTLEAQEYEVKPEREIPDGVVTAGQEYVRQYDDPHSVPGDVTRFKKIYATAAQIYADFDEKTFLGVLDQAKAAAAKYAYKKRNSKGRVNRVPYLFTCIENGLGFTLEELAYLRTGNPLYADNTVWEFVDVTQAFYQEQVDAQETDLKYREWLQFALDRLEHCKEPKERSNPTMRNYYGQS